MTLKEILTDKFIKINIIDILLEKTGFLSSNLLLSMHMIPGHQ